MSRLIVVLAAFAAGSPLFGQQEETSTARLLNNYIAEGAPGDNDDVEILVRSKTSLFVPMLEQKIEEILRSRSPEGLFKTASADPQRVAGILAMMIEARASRPRKSVEKSRAQAEGLLYIWLWQPAKLPNNLCASFRPSW